MKKYIGMLLLLTLIAKASPQAPVPLCDLVHNAKDYNGKEVTVRAFYRYGLEWSYLQCLECLDSGEVWVEFSNELDESSRNALKRGPKAPAVIIITLRGTFSTGGTYGHMDAFKYNLFVKSASNAIVVSKSDPGRPEDAKSLERWKCNGNKPK